MDRKTAAALAALTAASLMAAPVRATEVCAWLQETVDKDEVHNFALWIQADGELEAQYAMTGKGVYSDSGSSYGPGKGGLVLHRGVAVKPWSYGTNVNSPADIDIVAEIHAQPPSIFDPEPWPLLAAFTFRRHVPEDEKTPPKGFAVHQCKTVAAAPKP